MRISRIYCLNHLIGYGLRAVSYGNVTATGNICTTCCGVNISLGCINGTVNHNLRIHKVFIRSGIVSAGCISHRNKRLICCTGISAPLICVVYVNVNTAVKNTFCILTNDNLRTWQESNVLTDSNSTGHNLYGHIVLNTQLIFCRVDAGCTNRHVDGRYGNITVSLQNHTVCSFIIILNYVTAGQVEHSATAGNESNSRAEVRAGHIYGSICVFLRSGVKC